MPLLRRAELSRLRMPTAVEIPPAPLRLYCEKKTAFLPLQPPCIATLLSVRRPTRWGPPVPAGGRPPFTTSNRQYLTLQGPLSRLTPTAKSQPGVFDQHAGPTVEVLRPDRALSELARPVSPTPHMQPEAFVSTPERAYGNTARLTTPAAGVGDSAKIVTPEYAAGVLASAAIPHFVVGGKASPQSPYFSSGVQVTPTTRVDFVIPHALPFDAKAMFDAADALTAKRAPRVVEGGGVQDAFTPQPQADVQSTAEMVATHYTAHQQSALDRRY